jgi:hypothetical protein
LEVGSEKAQNELERHWSPDSFFPSTAVEMIVKELQAKELRESNARVSI